VGHLATGHQAHSCVIRQAEDVQEPVARELLHHRGGGATRVGCPVLVPDRGQPIGSDRRVETPADDESEVSGTLRPDAAGFAAATNSSITSSAGRDRSSRPTRSAARRATLLRGRGALATSSGTRPRSQRCGGAVRGPSRDTTASERSGAGDRSRSSSGPESLESTPGWTRRQPAPQASRHLARVRHDCRPAYPATLTQSGDRSSTDHNLSLHPARSPESRVKP
jgi:hypothetical protein